jgi:hypothetical protein
MKFGIERCLRVSLLFKSGAEVRFTADSIQTRNELSQALQSVKVERSHGIPHYYRLDDISAIITRHGWRWKR